MTEAAFSALIHVFAVDLDSVVGYFDSLVSFGDMYPGVVDVNSRVNGSFVVIVISIVSFSQFIEFYDFADTPDKLHKAKVALEEVADSVTRQVRLKTTMVERELFIHDYICQNTVYDEAAPYNQSAYSCLVMHKSVCAGYARAFQYLMQKAGFTCYYVAGRTDGLNGQVISGSNEGGSHSWNMVLLDGEYYNVDCLWDDTASDTYGSVIYPFFNLTDEAFRYHARISMAIGLPKCNGTKYKYSNYFGKTVEAENIVFVDAA